MKSNSLNRSTILLLVFFFTGLMIWMIKGFLLAVVMAAIFTGLVYPIYLKFCKWFGNRSILAGSVTLLLFVITILIPLVGISVLMIDQAINASKTAGPLLRELTSSPDTYYNEIRKIDFVQELFPNDQKVLEGISDFMGKIGNFFVRQLSHISSGAAGFLFSTFIFLFSMFVFLVNGREYLDRILYLLPLREGEEKLLLSKFTKVSAATLKGSLLIGLIQGTLGGGIMAVLGIPNYVFWGVLMVILSIIPAIGPILVWAPAAVILFAQGDTGKAIIMLLFGALVIGNTDNLLRPKLVGDDAQLPPILILFTTLGGISLFGIAGFILGPIIGALFLSVWDIYGRVFKESLFPEDLQEAESTTPEPQESFNKDQDNTHLSSSE